MEHAIHAENQAVEFTFRVTGDPATAAPSIRVLDNTGTLDSTLTVGSGLVAGTGVDASLVTGTFTPTAQGLWKLHATDAHGGDQVKDIAVGAHGLQWIVTQLVAMDAKLDVIDTVVDANAAALVIVEGKIDVALTDIATNLAAILTVDGKTDTVLANLSTMDGKLDTLQTSVDDINGGAHFG